MKVLVVACGDIHSNSTLGLNSPECAIGEEGGKVGKVQRWLWRSWLDFCSKVKEKEADYKIGIFNGDLADLNLRGGGAQLYSQNPSIILDNTIVTLTPMLDVLDAWFIVRGTVAHVDNESWVEEQLAKRLGSKTIAHSENVYSHYNLQHTIEGVRFDVAHHATGMSDTRWTRKNLANREAFTVISDYTDIGLPLPHLVLRSHVHFISDSGINYRHLGLRAMTLPAWQLKTSFVHGLGKSVALSDIGGYMFLCEGGKYELDDTCRYIPKQVGWKTVQIMK